MPLIQVMLVENVSSAEQKQQIVRRLTDAMVEIEGENMRAVTSLPLPVPVPAEDRLPPSPEGPPHSMQPD